MIDHPEHLDDLLAWAVAIIAFGTFTRAVQIVVSELQLVVFDELPSSMQSALNLNPLEPSWQSRNILILAVASCVYAGVCLHTLSWLSGLAAALMSFAAVLLLSRLAATFPDTAGLIRRLIERNLQERTRKAADSGDRLTAEAGNWALERLSEISR
ncbi:MAG: hypothetical protein WEF50_00455 [Myxococcota bacterium]